MRTDPIRIDRKTLPGGEIVYLERHPDGSWRVRLYMYEHQITVRRPPQARTMSPENTTALDASFESADAAYAHVDRLLESGALPRNPPPLV